uniref:Uncharacterized protein n=1 Tax=Arundo donax TaxID=35708 RepID=A0A0A8YA71_ARUDO
MEQHTEPHFAETKSSKLLELISVTTLVAVKIGKMHMGSFS